MVFQFGSLVYHPLLGNKYDNRFDILEFNADVYSIRD